jgi:hypothetical protein
MRKIGVMLSLRAYGTATTGRAATAGRSPTAGTAATAGGAATTGAAPGATVAPSVASAIVAVVASPGVLTKLVSFTVRVCDRVVDPGEERPVATAAVVPAVASKS